MCGGVGFEALDAGALFDGFAVVGRGLIVSEDGAFQVVRPDCHGEGTA